MAGKNQQSNAERAAFVWEAELSPVVTRGPKPRAGKVADLGAAHDVRRLGIGSAEVFELNTAKKGRGA